MEEFQRIILVHYHEIGLKGRNRGVFEKRLQKNLEALLGAYPVVTIHRISGRLLVFLREGTTLEVVNQCTDAILGVPGVARASCGFKCDLDIEVMGRAACIALAEAEPFSSFKVSARRNHTVFPIDSMQMNRDIGEVLCERFPEKRVQMKGQDVTVGVEAVEGTAYVYARSVRGIGGLPVGSSGKVVCLLSSGIDSPVATWRMARRGAVPIGVHFSGRPQTSDASEYLVDDIAHVLERTGCIGRVYVVPFGDYQREISLSCPPSLRVILYRRLMFRVAEELARREGAGALVTGESLGQVASQTLDNIRATNDAVELPVLRPLIGSDKLEIIEAAQELGTFEISSMDAPDCCTLFMPRNPETHAKLEAVREAEAAFPVDEWVRALADAAEPHDYACPAYKPPKKRESSRSRKLFSCKSFVGGDLGRPFLSCATFSLARADLGLPLRMAPRSAEGTEVGCDGGRRGERIGTFPRHFYGRARVSSSQLGRRRSHGLSRQRGIARGETAPEPRPPARLRRHRPCPGARGRARRFRLRDVARQRHRGDGGERRDGGAVGGRCWRGGGESRWGRRRQRHLAGAAGRGRGGRGAPCGRRCYGEARLHPCGRLRGGAGRLLFGGGQSRHRRRDGGRRSHRRGADRRGEPGPGGAGRSADRHPVACRRSGGILGRGRSDGILQLAGFRRPVSFGRRRPRQHQYGHGGGA